MNKLFFLASLFLPLLSFSQRLHVNLFGGVANYMGDLQDKPITFDQSNGAFGAGLQYDLTSHFSLRTGLAYGKVRAADKYNRPLLQLRNLSFETKIVEGNLLVQYNLFDLSERRITPYFFGGVAVYHFNPYAYDTLGSLVYLKPLSTEGQGLAHYPGKKPYKLTQFAIPLGVGFKFRVGDNMSLGYEFGMRKLFTDHLDDVSTTYVDQATLVAARGSKAVEMAFRGGEVKNAPAGYPVDGTVRGGATQKDWYYFHGVSITIGLRASNATGWRGNRTGCPVQVL